ncbi:MAG: hypothetical protein K0A95_05840 [Chromatiales bacterium]|nr:hypothetical protein [Gammaproteobacteria bacterium]MBW6476575.1 hypothetical protein [Chromatiales bacterium]
MSANNKYMTGIVKGDVGLWAFNYERLSLGGRSGHRGTASKPILAVAAADTVHGSTAQDIIAKQYLTIFIGFYTITTLLYQDSTTHLE